MATITRGFLFGALAVALLVVTPAALAAPCSGFTDVQDTDPLCPNVDWLRNRAITLGCTSPTLFCPTDVVSRLSMAVFMNRLGTALTPAFYDDERGGSGLDITNPTTICQTQVIPSAGHLRNAHAGGVMSAMTVGTAMPAINIVASIDNGATWFFSGLPSSGSDTNGFVNLVVWNSSLALLPGFTYVIGLRVQALSAGVNLGAYTCQVQAMVVSRTGFGPPY